MADALTQRQREILDFISASILERGFPPTLREISESYHRVPFHHPETILTALMHMTTVKL